MLDNLTILDFETTGLNPATCAVIEMAAVRVRQGQITSRFETLVNFGGEVPADITKLTSITTEQTRLGKEPKDAFRQLRAFIGQDTIVAHNARFDVAFLCAGLQQLGATVPFTNPFLCTVVVAQAVLPGLPKFNLVALCEHFNIERVQAHRAMSDVQDTELLLRKLYDELCDLCGNQAEDIDYQWQSKINRVAEPYHGNGRGLDLLAPWLPAHAQPLSAEGKEVGRG